MDISDPMLRMCPDPYIYRNREKAAEEKKPETVGIYHPWCEDSLWANDLLKISEFTGKRNPPNDGCIIKHRGTRTSEVIGLIRRASSRDGG
jgi:hypothetical protein